MEGHITHGRSRQNRSVYALIAASFRETKFKRLFERSRPYAVELFLVFSGAILVLSFILLISFTQLRRSSLSFEILFFLPFSIFFVSIIIIRKLYSSEHTFFLPILLVFSILIQLIIIFTEISLSDDLFRFFEEGKAVINGINPYTTSIDNFPPFLQDQYSDRVNNANITSPYPPGALFLFAALYFFYPNLFVYRLFFSIGFIISILVSYGIITPERRWILIIYAWNPILHLETANGAHYDAIVVLFVVLAIWALNSNRITLASGFFFIGFLLKYYPIFFVVIYWRRLGKGGQRFFFGGLFCYIIFVLLLPQSVYGLFIYAERWYFNASIFWLLFQVVQNFFITKVILGGLFILLLSISAFKVNKESLSPTSASLLIIGIFLLFQPVFHPWYIFWIYPFVLMDKNFNISWILLSGTLILSYHVYIAFDTIKIWKESDGLRLIEYIPFFFTLFVEKCRLKVRELKHQKRSLGS